MGWSVRRLLCASFTIIIWHFGKCVEQSLSRKVYTGAEGYYLFDRSYSSAEFRKIKEEASSDVTGFVGGVLQQDENLANDLSGVYPRRKRDVYSSSSNTEGDVVSFVLPDSLPQMLVHRARNNSSGVVILTRRLRSGKIDVATQSYLYFSHNNGRTFERTSIINRIDQFYYVPSDYRSYVFVNVEGREIITTNDICRSFNFFTCPFKPSFLSIHPFNGSYIIGYDKYNSQRSLWLSKDFGQTWTKVQHPVKKAYWGTDKLGGIFEHTDALYVERKEPTGKITILRSETFFSNDSREHVVISNIDQFYIKNSSLFAVKADENGNYNLFIALERHSKFAVANFPTNDTREEFFIVDVADNQIVVLVKHRFGKTNLYTSDPNTVNFKLSLENVTYFNPETRDYTTVTTKKDPFADIHKVKGLRSIFIANTATIEKYDRRYNMSDMKTVISFDKGATWEPILPPLVDSNGQPPCPGPPVEQCSLQLTQAYHSHHSKFYTTPVMSETSSPGYIFASGKAGARVPSQGDLFFSSNGGKNWKEIRKGEWYYRWADHGGILAIVKKGSRTNKLFYSLDEGDTWDHVTFQHTPIFIYAILTESGEAATVFTLYGVRNVGSKWILIRVDLTSAFRRQFCQQIDYTSWSPEEDYGMPCTLGTKVAFQRRHYNSAPCLNGESFDRDSVTVSCPCTRSDFQCDKGFHPMQNTLSSVCVSENNSTREINSVCKDGTFYYRTRGYQKIVGNICEGGDAESQYGPDKTPCPSSGIALTAPISGQ